MKKELFLYLKDQAQDTDIFCFQEVFSSAAGPLDFKGARCRLFSELRELLTGFEGYFSPAYGGWIDMQKVGFEIFEGQAIFVKNSFSVKDVGATFIFGQQEMEITADFINEPKNLQYVQLDVAGKDLLIANAHGKWHPGEKLDTPERIEQSQRVLAFLKKYSCPKILCGDFNLLPETKSIRMLEGDLKNLIKEYRIKSTRNQISWKRFSNMQHFADYAFVSKAIKVRDFAVPYNEVSDHLPLVLKFDIEWEG